MVRNVASRSGFCARFSVYVIVDFLPPHNKSKMNVKLAPLFKLIPYAHNPRLPQVRYDKLPQSNGKIRKCNY